MTKYRVRLYYHKSNGRESVEITQTVVVKAFRPEYAVKDAREAFTEQFGVEPQSLDTREH